MRQSNATVSFTGGVVQQNFIGRLCPNCGEFNGSWAVKNELVTAATTILVQFKFAHWKVIFQQVFFATQRDVNKMSQMVQRANLGGCFGKMWSGNRLTHAETALTER